MTLEAYFDESSTDGGVYVVAGYVAKAESWAAFASDWEKLLPRTYPGPGRNGQRRFKMSEMTRRMEHVPAFYEVIAKHIPLSVSAMIDAKTLQCARDRIWSDNRTLLWTPTSEPDVMILPLLVFTLFDIVCGNEAAIRKLDGPDRIDVYFDANSRESWLRDAWADGVEALSPHASAFVGSLRFERDEEFLPLQAADFWAWWVRDAYENGTMEQLKAGRFGSWTGKPRSYVQVTLSEDQVVDSLMKKWREGFIDGPVNVYDAKVTPRSDRALPQHRVSNRASMVKMLKRAVRDLRGRLRQNWWE